MRSLLFNSMLGLIGAAAIGVPALLVTSYRPSLAEQIARNHGEEFHPTPPAWELARLRKIAVSSCDCARRSSDEAGAQACWHAFRVATANARPSGTLCDPLSADLLFYDDSDEFIVLRYSFGSPNGDDFCTQEEAMEAEALFYRIANDGNPAASERATAAMEHLSREFARGKPVMHAEPTGCVGG